MELIGFDDIGEIIMTNNEDTQILSPYNNLNAQINAYLKREKQTSMLAIK